MKNNAIYCLIVFMLLVGLSTNVIALELSQFQNMALESQGGIPISVTVSGMVPMAGQVKLTSQSRLYDALSQNGFFAYYQNVAQAQDNQTSRLSAQAIDNKNKPFSEIMQQYESGKANKQDLQQEVMPRFVELRRNGKMTIFDLYRYLRLGDVNQNPQMKDGDILFVQPITGKVQVGGEVQLAGEYPLGMDDTYQSVLDLSLGLTGKADKEHIRLYQVKDGKSQLQQITLSALTGLAPKAEDKIEVPVRADLGSLRKVKVLGRVASPGEQTIVENGTLLQVLQNCGGPLNDGDLANAFVLNGAWFNDDNGLLKRIAAVPGTISRDDISYIKVIYRQQAGRYSVDMKKLWESKDSKLDIVLHDGDIVIIPERVSQVQVSGQVVRPGLVEWKDDISYNDYIQQCGGLAWNAHKKDIRIIREGSGNWIRLKQGMKIYPGDTIFVPEKDPDYVWTQIRDVVSFTSQIATIMLAIKNLSQ